MDKTFKVGDRIKNNGNNYNGPNSHKFGVVVKVEDNGTVHVKYDDGCTGQDHGQYECYDLIKSKQTMLQKLSSTLKRVLTPSLQKQYKAGFRNGDLALTEVGKNELLEILANAHEKELTDSADEVVKEEENEKKN